MSAERDLEIAKRVRDLIFARIRAALDNVLMIEGDFHDKALLQIIPENWDNQCGAVGCLFPQYNGEPLCRMHMQQGPCVWCGKTWEQHSPDAVYDYIQRTPCLGTRGGFVSRERIKVMENPQIDRAR